MDLDNLVDFKDAEAGEDFGEEIDGEASNESASRGCNARADLECLVALRDQNEVIPLIKEQVRHV